MTRVAVVTGAARGIGSAISELLEQERWQVIRLDREPMDHERALRVDLADATATADALSRLERVDGLVNNAALQLNKPLLETSIEEWDAVAAVNVRAAFVCMKALHRQLTESNGAVVNIGSVHARATSRSIAAYATSKGALSALTRAAAIELAPMGVRVNAILPGAIDTSALTSGFSRQADAERNLIERTPLGRIGEPREIAHMASFLLDAERSGFATGQEFVVDGGALARLASE
ncbi:MAG: SDR family NAD(P)-dependent oxidoreductase [Solirubrobacteraceae bacterium]